MSIPSPAKALDGHCSTVYNGKLYVFSSNSFQSIDLKQGGQWTQEANGKAVSGAACTIVEGSNAALYVVGGTTDDTTYKGLQRYLFGSKTWETLTPPVDVMQNRVNHSATFLPDSNSILVYAGSQPDAATFYSSQTFTIVAQAPWIIDSFSSMGHTANLPILERWNSSHAVMTGGSYIDPTVMLFKKPEGWSLYDTSLPAPLAPEVKAQLITGTDGSKVLQTYDLSQSPNQVFSVLLQSANGQPAQVGTLLGSSKRDLSVSSWPIYNNTIAPTITRSDYSVASDGQGLVAFAGGNTAQSVNLFNQTSNGWIDTSRFFYGANAPATTASSTAAPTSSSSSAATTSSAAAAATTTGTVPDAVIADAASRQHALLVLELGVIIGVCGGLFVLFLAILLYLRWRKRRRNNQDTYGEGGRMSFADRGASFMKEAEGSTHNFFPTADRYNNSSRVPPFAPAATRTSRFSKPRFSRGSGRGSGAIFTHHSKSSWESTKELVEKDVGYNVEPVEMVPVSQKPLPSIIRKPAPTYHSDRAEIANVLGLAPDEEKDRRKRSSGWSRYFATSNPAGDSSMSHIPSAYRKPRSVDATIFAQDMAYARAHPEAPLPTLPSHIPESSLMPPLNIDFTKTIDGQRLSKVASSNPSYSDSKEDLAKRGSTIEAQSGEIEGTSTRPISGITTSSYAKRRTRSSIAASEFFAAQHGINGTWTPMTTSFKDHINDGAEEPSRRTSSMYTSSIYGDRPQSRRKSGGSGFFPGAGKTKSKNTYSTLADWDTVKDDLRIPAEFKDVNQARESNITVFPEPVGDTYTAIGRGPSQKSAKNGSGMAGLTTAASSQDRASNMTLFPRAVSAKHYPGAAKETDIDQPMPTGPAHDNDVSWVNLGYGAAK